MELEVFEGLKQSEMHEKIQDTPSLSLSLTLVLLSLSTSGKLGGGWLLLIELRLERLSMLDRGSFLVKIVFSCVSCSVPLKFFLCYIR